MKKKTVTGFSYVFFLFFGLAVAGCGEKDTAQNFQAIEYRLGRLEQKLTRLELREENSGTRESRMKRFQDQLRELEKDEKTLAMEIRKLDQKLDLLQKEASKPAPRVVRKPPLRKPVKKVSASPAGQTGVHVVRSGETLYRIAAKYGMSIRELRRLNQLSESQFIFPGQELRVFSKTR